MWIANRIISVDPGLVSGVAIFDYEDDDLTLYHSDELHWQELGELCENVFADGGEGLAVVGERFTITAKTVKNSQAPWSLQVLGMVQWLAYKHGVGDYALQSPSEAKTMFPNERLHHLGYWHRGGEGHARDAIRHGLLWGLHNGWRNSRLLS